VSLELVRFALGHQFGETAGLQLPRRTRFLDLEQVLFNGVRGRPGPSAGIVSESRNLQAVLVVGRHSIFADRLSCGAPLPSGVCLSSLHLVERCAGLLSAEVPDFDCPARCGRSLSCAVRVAMWVSMAWLVMVMWRRSWRIAPSLFRVSSAFLVCRVVGVFGGWGSSGICLSSARCWVHCCCSADLVTVASATEPPRQVRRLR
jgi:hypothetical protein